MQHLIYHGFSFGDTAIIAAGPIRKRGDDINPGTFEFSRKFSGFHSVFRIGFMSWQNSVAVAFYHHHASVGAKGPISVNVAFGGRFPDFAQVPFFQVELDHSFFRLR